MYKFLDEKGQHLHTLNEKPLLGTTTVLKILAKPLTWWASGMAVGKLGWTNSKIRVKGKYQTIPLSTRLEAVRGQYELIKTLSFEQYLDLLDEAYKAHDEYKKERGEVGTDRHALLEAYVKQCIQHNTVYGNLQEYESIKDFTQWAKNNVKKFLWSEAHVYSTELWTGGIADVGWEDNEGRIIAGDFKSSKEAYFDQFLQCAGYDIMLSENGGHDENGNKIYTLDRPIQGYCVVPFGGDNLAEDIKLSYDTDSYKEGFKSVVHLYKLNQQFN